MVTVVAPPGYGKTTLMAQWAKQAERPTAWVTLDHADNDPSVLVRSIVAGLTEAGHIAGDGRSHHRVRSEDALTLGVSRLIADIAASRWDGLLILDDAESLTSRASRDIVSELAFRIPPSLTLIIGSRMEPPVKVAALRLRGRLLEVGTDDLAMLDGEARALLDAAEVDVGSNFADVMARTEGWPAGLYLVALSIKAGVPPDQAVRTGGDDRIVVDYLRLEVVRRLTPARVEFLMRTSILDTMCGALCDEVMAMEGSAEILEMLERRNMLIVPLDRTRTWYRYHYLLRDHLEAELNRKDPRLAAELHSRAARWYASHSMIIPAVRHAQLADDVDLVATLVGHNARATFGSGSIDTVMSWFSWLDASGRLSHQTELVLLRAFAGVLTGAAAKRWVSMALDEYERDGTGDDSPAGLLLRCLVMPEGIEGLRVDAETLGTLEWRDSEWYPASLLVRAMALLWSGEIDQADQLLTEATIDARDSRSYPTASFSYALRAGIAEDRGHHAEAMELATQGVTLVRRHGLARTATSCLPLVVRARIAAGTGDAAEAKRLLAEASAIRPLLSQATPGMSMHSLLETVRASIAVADFAGARFVMREASDIHGEQPRLGTLGDLHRELKDHLASLPAGDVGATSLTNAELRLLPLLATHLSFPEIAERLYVSRHTVKTQAMSVYRKLEVSSRSQAVERAGEIGLLGS